MKVITLKILLLHALLFLILFNISAQVLSIKKIKEVPRGRYSDTKDSTLVFPVFVLRNKKIEKRINEKIQRDFKEENDINGQGNDLRLMLKKSSEAGLTSIDFEVINQTRRIISFSFQVEAMGAYPTSWQKQYCFSLQTGNLITVDSLIKKIYINTFVSLIKKRLEAIIKLYKEDLFSQLQEKGFDRETYDWAMDNVKENCWNNYAPTKFNLYKSKIEIVIDCEFPHAIQNLSPQSSITFTLDEIRKFLNRQYF
ncbi:MAG: hypothetical protein ABIO55_17765 [Ginsengibacter sp.]